MEIVSEGLAAGPAIEERWGENARKLTDRNEVWELEAYYLAQALVQYILIVSPKKIIMGGGVMKQVHLLPLVHKQVVELLNGYVPLPQITERIDEYIVLPDLGDDAGITGALVLAEWATKK